MRGILLAAFAYSCARAAALGFTHDEALTCLLFVRGGFGGIFRPAGPLLSNSHLRNSLLMKVFSGAFGTSEFVLEDPGAARARALPRQHLAIGARDELLPRHARPDGPRGVPRLGDRAGVTGTRPGRGGARTRPRDAPARAGLRLCVGDPDELPVLDLQDDRALDRVAGPSWNFILPVMPSYPR